MGDDDWGYSYEDNDFYDDQYADDGYTVEDNECYDDHWENGAEDAYEGQGEVDDWGDPGGGMVDTGEAGCDEYGVDSVCEGWDASAIDAPGDTLENENPWGEDAEDVSGFQGEVDDWGDPVGGVVDEDNAGWDEYGVDSVCEGWDGDHWGEDADDVPYFEREVDDWGDPVGGVADTGEAGCDEFGVNSGCEGWDASSIDAPEDTLENDNPWGEDVPDLEREVDDWGDPVGGVIDEDNAGWDEFGVDSSFEHQPSSWQETENEFYDDRWDKDSENGPEFQDEVGSVASLEDWNDPDGGIEPAFDNLEPSKFEASEEVIDQSSDEADIGSSHSSGLDVYGFGSLFGMQPLSYQKITSPKTTSAKLPVEVVPEKSPDESTNQAGMSGGAQNAKKFEDPPEAIAGAQSMLHTSNSTPKDQEAQENLPPKDPKHPPESEPYISEDYEFLLAASDANLLPNLEPFDCPLCKKSFQAYEQAMLSDCVHTFCKQCLVATIRSAQDVEVRCPALVDDGSVACSGTLHDGEIRALLPSEEYNKYLQKCVQKAEAAIPNAVHCRVPNCPGWIEVEGCVGAFVCPVCSAENNIPSKTTAKASSTKDVPTSVNVKPPATNEEPSLCHACFRQLPAGQALVLLNCQHSYCFPCVENASFNDETGAIECPYPCGLFECKTKLADHEVAYILAAAERAGSRGGSTAAKEVTQLLNSVNLAAKHSTGAIPKIAPTLNKEDLRRLKTLSDSNLPPNPEAFKCPICTEIIKPNEGVMRSSCFHMFCRPCLVGTINHADDVVVQCPALPEGTVHCSATLLDCEIRELLSEQEFNRYQDRCLQKAEAVITNTIHCLKPNCPGWVEVVGYVDSFSCPVCSSKNCVFCKAIHPGKTCKEHQDTSERNKEDLQSEEALKQMEQKREGMRCPGCGIMIQKNAGCDFIRCSKCKAEICWPTRGPRWGPGGPGDESGGCRCRLEKRCHPECEGCHFA